MSYPQRPLGEALSLVDTSEQVEIDRQYRITGVYSFGKGLIRRPTINGSQTAYNSLSRLSAGQVVISKLGAWEGAIAFVDAPFDGTYVSAEYPVFNVNENDHDSRYIAHLVTWPKIRGQLVTQGSMARRKRTTPTQFLAAMVPLPNRSEQRRVAVKLDESMAKLGRANNLRKAAQVSYRALQESLIAQVSNPVMRTVGSVMELKRRAVCVDPSTLYREIGLRSFGRGVFHKQPVAGESLGAKRIFSIEPGDLLFSSVFAWEGAVARASEAERGRVGSHRFMTYVVDGALADADYLRFFFLSAPGLEVLRRCSPGGAGRNKTLGIKSFQSAQIPVPPVPEQRRIVRMLLAAEQISLRSSAEYELRAETCRVSLLNAAFTGRL